MSQPPSTKPSQPQSEVPPGSVPIIGRLIVEGKFDFKSVCVASLF